LNNRRGKAVLHDRAVGVNALCFGNNLEVGFSINPTQYFDGITPDLWTYQIGGYQVLAKWLKGRKGRYLTSADTIHYFRVVTSLRETIRVQGNIDVVVVDSRLFGVTQLEHH
jgi:hypothetical protein